MSKSNELIGSEKTDGDKQESVGRNFFQIHSSHEKVQDEHLQNLALKAQGNRQMAEGLNFFFSRSKKVFLYEGIWISDQFLVNKISYDQLNLPYQVEAV